MYEVKKERTGKRKVLHRAWLLLWLADYGNPVRCNLIMISDTLPGTVPGQLEPMTSHIGREVRTGIPLQAAGHRIPTDCEEKSDQDSLGSPWRRPSQLSYH